MIRGDGTRCAGVQVTKRGALEASGGAQMSLAPRPPVAVQPALF